MLIFSTAKDAPTDIPLTSLTDHTFGVRCVAFSPDSQYLASLGGPNDGFLYVWRINERSGAATLFASNKCTSNITQMAWMGTKLVTIGTRHVKVWRVEQSNPPSPVRPNDLLQSVTSPDHRTLFGRNCVLGDLLEATFTTIVSLDASRAILCSDKGTVCLLSDKDGQQRFVKLREVPFAVTAAFMASEEHLLLAGDRGELQTMKLDGLEQKHDHKHFWRSQSKNHASFPLAQVPRSADVPPVIAFVPLQDVVGTLDCRGVIRVVKLGAEKDHPPTWSCNYKLPAHGGPVLGVRAMDDNNDMSTSFFTWSGEGVIMFWDSDGRCKNTVVVQIEQLGSDEGLPNELRVVRYLPSKSCVVTGDKYGILR